MYADDVAKGIIKLQRQHQRISDLKIMVVALSGSDKISRNVYRHRSFMVLSGWQRPAKLS
jgi:hypothetical protein